MSDFDEGLLEEVIRLANASLFAQATPQEIERLEQLVLSNDEACRLYVDVMFDAQELRRWSAAPMCAYALDANSLALSPDSHPMAPVLPTEPAPTFALLDSTIHGAVSYFSSGWPVAYLVATMILGIGLLVGSLVYVSQPVQTAVQLPSTEKISSVPEAKIELVGQITGMVDCQWADKSTATINGAVVPLGRKYALVSGLMEITYDTGARVILQGPCTYNVESKDSGYLSVGKVTARLEKKAESGKPKAELADSLSAFGSPLSAFAVRTPTATVTDLGTEFGVEVGRDGDTRTQVFVGSVRVTAAESGSETGQVVQAGQAAAVGAKSAQVVIVQIDPEDKSPFVRVVTPSKQPTQSKDSYADLVLSMNPAVYYRMERPREEKNRNILIDSAPGARHGVVYMGDEFGLPHLSGRFGQSLGLRGESSGDYAIVSHCPEASTNQLSFSAWVRADSRPEDRFAGIAGLGASLPLTNQFVRIFLTTDLTVNVRQPDGSDATVREGKSHPLPLSSWEHVAFVADGSALRLYRNGEEVASSPCSGIRYDRSETDFTMGALKQEDYANDKPAGYWRGRLDEVALFHSALTPDQVRQLYLAKRLVSTATKSVSVPSEQPDKQR